MGYIQLFRIDDITWDMNYENFSKIRDLFFQYDIRPIIGVIPHNEDPKLKEQAGEHGIAQERFWEEMRSLQRDHGWAIALHGYSHVYVTGDCGMFKVKPRSEFAGLPYEQQEEKIRKGKAILEENGLCVDAFMAPGHSLDWNTVKALKENDITVITDGLTAYPYRKNGVLFVPQIWPWPRREIYGIATACFHINTWESVLFLNLEKFIQASRNNCGTFQNAVDCSLKKDHRFWEIANAVSKITIFVEKKCRITGSRIKRTLMHRGEQ